MAGHVAREKEGGGGETNHKGFWWENLDKRNNLEYANMDERTISDWILKK